MSNYQALIQQRKELDARIEQARREEIAGAVTQIKELVRQFDLQPSDIFSTRTRGRTTSKVPPKYRDPVSGKTWTGRGRAPKWIDGRDRNLFLIK